MLTTSGTLNASGVRAVESFTLASSGVNTLSLANANFFTFAAAGNNTIADFTAGASNRIVFSNAGFALGLGGASATPQALPAALIGNLTTGAFTTMAQRFAYNQSTGQLLYDAGGGTTPAATQLVATLTGDPAPALTAPHLFFVT